MDPELAAILQSRDPAALLQEQRPAWVLGADRVGGFQSVGPQPIPKDRFAAPTRGSASANLVKTALEGVYDSDKSFYEKAARLLAKIMLGSTHPADVIERDEQGRIKFSPERGLEDALSVWNPAMGVAGILGGKVGAARLGGATAERFAGGEAAAAKGAPSQQLWREHGYDVGAEGKGRFEISDEGLQVYNPRATTVGGGIAHPELYAAYPEIKNLPLSMRIDAALKAPQGWVDPATQQVNIRARNVEEARSIAAHELNHIVQSKEGHALGYNLSEGPAAYRNTAGEIESENVQARLADPNLRRLAPSLTERDVPREEQIVRQDPRAVMAAVKPLGGMWHPEAVRRLTEPLERQLRANLPADEGHALGDWAESRVRTWLNRYAGTERDPLKDVEIPYGDRTARWEDVTDSLIKGSPIKDLLNPDRINPNWRMNSTETVWDARPMYSENPLGQGDPAAAHAITSYLSHVGNFLRQNVIPRDGPPLWYQRQPRAFKDKYPRPNIAEAARVADLPEASAKEYGDWAKAVRESPEYQAYKHADPLQQYDLVRAVKETAANDARVAKEMEKAAAASTKDLPVYKEYPDGMRWVELKLPEKLTEGQAKNITHVNEIYKKPNVTYGDTRMDSGYIALDPQGKAIKNSYTGDSAWGKTPQEAHLAGQLAQEGNQMGHCVGGYCEGVASGGSRIFSLRDAKGRSHVTIEVEPRSVHDLVDSDMRPYLSEAEIQEFAHLPIGEKRLQELSGKIPANILQIKGKQNRAPVAEYLPYVQDFVRSGKWGKVGDLGNTGLYRAPEPSVDSAHSVFRKKLRELHGEKDYYTKEEMDKAAELSGWKGGYR